MVHWGCFVFHSGPFFNQTSQPRFLQASAFSQLCPLPTTPTVPWRCCATNPSPNFCFTPFHMASLCWVETDPSNSDNENRSARILEGPKGKDDAPCMIKIALCQRCFTTFFSHSFHFVTSYRVIGCLRWWK